MRTSLWADRDIKAGPAHHQGNGNAASGNERVEKRSYVHMRHSQAFRFLIPDGALYHILEILKQHADAVFHHAWSDPLDVRWLRRDGLCLQWEALHLRRLAGSMSILPRVRSCYHVELTSEVAATRGKRGEWSPLPFSPLHLIISTTTAAGGDSKRFTAAKDSYLHDISMLRQKQALPSPVAEKEAFRRPR